MGWININMDDELHRKAKAISATRGQTLRDYLVELIKNGLDKEGSGE